MPYRTPKDGVFPAGIKCDPLTGDIMFTSDYNNDNPMVGVMAILVKQWKRVNGVMTVVGITRRDLQMYLFKCGPNNPPYFATRPSDPDEQPRMAWSICAGQQLCFDIVAKDKDYNPPVRSDTTAITWNQALARYGATLTRNYNPANRKVDGPREDDWKFCWQPDEDRASTTPYYFTVTAKDDRCPFPGNATRAFSVKVLAAPDVILKKDPYPCGSWKVRYELPPNKLNQAFTLRSWQISREPGDFSFLNGSYNYNDVAETPVMPFTKGGRYLVMLTAAVAGPSADNPCTKIFYDTLVVDTPVSPIVQDTFVCKGSPVTIEAKAKNGKPTYTYRWYNNRNDTLVPLNQSADLTVGRVTVSPLETRNYTIQVRDIEGCRVYDSITVEVKKLPEGVLPDSIRICFGDSAELDPGDESGNIKKFLWSTGDTVQQITRNDSNTFIVELTDEFKCTQNDTVRLFVNRPVVANAGMDTSVCALDTATLRGSGGNRYMWQNITKNTLVSGKSHTATVKTYPDQPDPIDGTFNAVTQYLLTVYQSYPDTNTQGNTIIPYRECSNTDTVTITVRPLPRLTRPQPVQACRSTQLVNAPTFGNNQPGGLGIWSYPRAPGAVVSGSLIQFRVDSLKNVQDTFEISQKDNWLIYTYTSPPSFGGCTRVDSSIVRIYGVPDVRANAVLWCENGGIMPIVNNASPLNRELYRPTGTANQEEWTGAGITSTTVGINKLHYFNPNAPGVQKMPAVNIQKYRYTHIYNADQPAIRIDCANEDTAAYRVTPVPTIDAGSNIAICWNEPLLNIAQRAGATISPATGASYWRPANLPTQVPTNINGVMRDSVKAGGVFQGGWSSFLASAPNPNNPGQYVIDKNIPNPGTRAYRMYYEDNSTGCLVRDSMTLTVARVPEVSLTFANPADSLVCLDDANPDVYFNTWVDGAKNSTGAYSESPAFARNMLGIEPGNSIFNKLHSSVQLSNKLKYSFTRDYTGVSCTSADSVTIRTQVPPTIDVTTGGAICAYDDSIPVSVAAIGAGYFHKWSVMNGIPGTFSDEEALNTHYFPSASEKLAGTVWIKATTTNDDKCPTASDSTMLTIHSVPVAEALSDTAGCVPITATFKAAPSGLTTPVNYSWRWLAAGGNTSSTDSITRTFATYASPGLYAGELTVTSQVGNCVDIDTFFVRTHPVPVAKISSDPPYSTTIAKPNFNFYDQSTIADNSPLSYLWKLGKEFDEKKDTSQMRYSRERNPFNVEYAADTGKQIVWLIVTSQFGCVDSIDHPIEIKPDITVFIPNAFFPGSGVNCPNGELCNRVFKIAADGYMTVEIFIFNRWGQQVYYSKDPDEGWNGKMNNGKDGGQDCPQEVYIYQVNATSYNGKGYRYSGSVTLLR